ncbi:esterase/lipase family protein [Pseudolysinimonas sp.]|uniref:esterase/lipase family protein n=1 Tax=Pseudolysinimonas sp. TaxID=2680009 RepID=UPI003F7E309B
MTIRALLADLPNGMRLRAGALRERRPPLAWRDGTLAPVVLLPGTYETWHLLAPIGAALHADGHPVHVIETIGANSRPIPWVVAEVARALVERDLRGAVLVAHSKGGIVGKQLLVEELAAADDVRRVAHLVAIATPFAGSSMARLVPAGALRAFLPGDALLARLAAERASDARITSIYPRVDPHVPEGSYLDGAENIEIDVVGHFRVLADPRTVAAVRGVVARR